MIKIKIYFVLFILLFAFLSGCSSQPTSTIEIPSDGTTSISINGNQFQVRDGNVMYNGQEIDRPEDSTLKIKHEGSSIFIYVDDKLLQEVRIDE